MKRRLGIALALILLTILIYEAAKLRFHSGVGAWNHSRRPVLRFHGYADLSSYRKHSHRIYAAAAVLCAQYRYGAKAGKLVSVLFGHRQLHSKVMAAPCRTTDDGSSFILSKAILPSNWKLNGNKEILR